ncbi:MAG TPA: hypothetical protein VGC58_02630 [Candidatus Paceibacterota bacterium]
MEKYKYLYKNNKLKLLGIFLSFITLFFVITEHFGMWDRIRCTNELLEYNSRIQTSYAEVTRTITPENKEWRCVTNTIYKYSNTKLQKDKKPIGIVRFVATQSFKQNLGENNFAEWTAPSTPIAFVYKQLPDGNVLNEDLAIVGSIGEFESWIEKDKNEFKFIIQNIFLGVLSFSVAVLAL